MHITRGVGVGTRGNIFFTVCFKMNLKLFKIVIFWGVPTPFMLALHPCVSHIHGVIFAVAGPASKVWVAGDFSNIWWSSLITASLL